MTWFRLAREILLLSAFISNRQRAAVVFSILFLSRSNCSPCTCRHAVLISPRQTSLARNNQRTSSRSWAANRSKFPKFNTEHTFYKNQKGNEDFSSLSAEKVDQTRLSQQINFSIDGWKQARDSSSCTISWREMSSHVRRSTLSIDFHPNFPQRNNIDLTEKDFYSITSNGNDQDLR